jgi:hypothetical protein
MKTSLPVPVTRRVLGKITESNAVLAREYPGEPKDRQPIHTIYGGAQLFKADAVPKLGRVALATFDEYAPNFVVLAEALRLRGFEELPRSCRRIEEMGAMLESTPDTVRFTNPSTWLAWEVYQRTRRKLEREPVEDFRIDFEDGYGVRPDEEEDHHAEFAARELAAGMKAGSLSPFIGIRIKPFTEELKAAASCPPISASRSPRCAGPTRSPPWPTSSTRSRSTPRCPRAAW